MESGEGGKINNKRAWFRSPSHRLSTYHTIQRRIALLVELDAGILGLVPQELRQRVGQLAVPAPAALPSSSSSSSSSTTSPSPAAASALQRRLLLKLLRDIVLHLAPRCGVRPGAGTDAKPGSRCEIASGRVR